ncbi:MAG: MG2 domain-containing protein, partial [Bacteroidota bacterium]|nr:MG2 domain-containing protein [Bacteroidota bacterium]
MRLKEFTPGEEVPLSSTFSFVFSKDVAPAGEQDQWLDEAYIIFEPAITGKFKWVSANTLIFSPEGPLAPAQEYKAEFTDKITGNTGYKNGAGTIEFHTPYFNVAKVDLFWKQAPGTGRKVSVQANVTFNYPVQPSEALKGLEITKGGQKVDNITAATQEISDVVTVTLSDMQQTEKEQEFTFHFAKGLLSALPGKKLKNEREFSVVLEPLEDLAVKEVTAGFDGGNGWVEIITTQEVDKEAAEKYITLTPGRSVKFTTGPNNIRIEGAFEGGETVFLKIEKGLPGLFGSQLKEAYSQDVVFANIDPSVHFSDQRGRYLMSGGNKNLGVEAVNIPSIDVEVYQIFRNNVLFFLTNSVYHESGGWYEDDYYYDGESDEYYSSNGQNYNVTNYGRKLYSDTIRITGGNNRIQEVRVNMNKALGQQPKGLYVVKVNSSKDRWRQDSKYIAISDIGLIAKYSDDELLVWANSIATAGPVAGVKVKLISTNNQVMLEGTTNSAGVIHLKNIKNTIGDFRARLITAELGDDFNYLDLRESRIETSRFDVGGKADNVSGHDAFVYSERNLYRPGETMHLSAIVRTNELGTATDLPLIVKVMPPTGRVLQEWRKNTNAQGSFELSFDIPQYAPTGRYTAEVYTGTDVQIGNFAFSVEEFAPDQIRVNLTPGKTDLIPGQEMTLGVQAEYLFGSPASGHNYEVDIHFSHRPYVSKRYPKYTFSKYVAPDTRLENHVQEGVLNTEGKATATYVTPTDIKSGGYLEANALTNVFDVTGRPVARMASYKIYPNDYFIGIKQNGYYHGLNKNITYQIIAVTPQDADKKLEVEVELIRKEWQTVLRHNYSGRYYYASERKEYTEWKRNVSVLGPYDLNFAVSKPASYELRVRKSGADQYVTTTFYAYGYANNMSTNFEVDKEGNIDIIPDKTVYKPGEVAKVLFVTPFSGKMLVTIERNGLYDYSYVDVKNNSAEITFPVKDDHLPNVYISATLFRKHNTDNDIPFLAGHGWAPLKVENPANKIQVNIKAPSKIKPNRTQEIEIRSTPGENVYVTLAAVDEGILQIKDYQTPDPYAYM